MKKSILVIPIMLTACLPDMNMEDDLKFDRNEWLKADKEGGEREMMMEDLSENFLYKGIKKDSVLYLLGKPDSVRKEQLLYLVSIAYDPCYLSIGFQNNRLAKIEKECN